MDSQMFTKWKERVEGMCAFLGENNGCDGRCHECPLHLDNESMTVVYCATLEKQIEL